MKFLLSHRHKLLYNRHEIPFHYRSERVPGALPLYVKGDFGDYLTQTIVTDGCSMQLNLFNIIKEALFYPFSASFVLPLHFMLKGNILCWLEGSGEAWLRHKRYNPFYIPGGTQHKAWFTPGFYKSFHIDFSPRYLVRLASGHAELEEVSRHIKSRSAQGVQQHAAHITPQIEKMVNDCMAFPKQEPDKGFFMEIRSKELLLKYVQDEPVEAQLPGRDASRLMKHCAAYVNAHLNYPFTIRSLSEQFHVSEISFRRQFARYTGSTFGRFLLKARMKKAEELLLTTGKYIRDIAAEVGYFDLSSFDRAFTRKFGESPRHFRSRHRGKPPFGPAK